MSDENLTDDRPGTRTVYATDNSIYQIAPAGVVVATDAASVSQLVQANRASVHPRSITARGAGTGTNAQSLTDGLILDTKRSMNQILDLDVGAKRVTVEPGVVTAELNEQLAPHGLFWPPSTSTVNRATVGGMIATDAAGQGSLRYGRTSRHVVALDVVLDDGTHWSAHAVPRSDAQRLAGGEGRVAEIWQALLAVPDRGFDLPELARGFSGYGIDRVHGDGMIDPIPVLCGSEGTLAITTAATLALTPIPAEVVTVVAAYDSFDEALVDSLRLSAADDYESPAPIAIETLDETTMNRGRSSTAWPLLEPLVGDSSGSMLLLDFATEPPMAHHAESPPLRLDSAIELINDGGLATSVTRVNDPAVRAAVWKVRADAVGLLAKVKPGAPRPTAFVEDCAVPVARMPEFIVRFRAILDGHGVSYGMFGHADVGCVHVRPAIDPIDASHETLVKAITSEVVELLSEMGGILWGEHGRGVRGQYAQDFLAPDVVQVMRALKTAFDPTDRFNPGKLYRPLSATTPLLQIDGVATRASFDRQVPGPVRAQFATAFSCNGNGLCHHYSSAEVMCPSFKATGDPSQAPKGRADLLRAWLRAEEHEGATEELTNDVVTSLDRCLSCAACTGRCPVQVDIPELKSRFFDRLYRDRRRPLAHHLLSRFERLAGLSAIAPPLSAAMTRLAGPRLGLVDLPVAPRKQASGITAFDAASPTDVVIVGDVFTTVFEPATLRATGGLLEAMGLTVSLSAFVPSGKFDHVKGNRKRFANAAKAQAKLIRSITGAGATPVVIDPAVALLYDHEYPAILDSFPTNLVRGLAEVAAERAASLTPVRQPQKVRLFGHCTERSLAPDWVPHWQTLLSAVGHDVEVIETTCCGMAGIFGHESDNQTVSATLFNRGWQPHLSDPQSTDSSVAVAATGWSCRSQAKRFGHTQLQHPVHLLGD